AVTVLLLAGAAIGRGSRAAAGSNFRGPQMPRPSIRGFWSLGLVVASAIDLITFGTGLHYSVSLDQLDNPSPAGQFLESHSGPWRAFNVIPPLTPSVQPDRLVALAVQ